MYNTKWLAEGRGGQRERRGREREGQVAGQGLAELAQPIKASSTEPAKCGLKPHMA